MQNTALRLTSTSPENTAQIARTLAGQLAAGDVMLLSGAIGAGKSHFCRSLILSLLPHPEDVPSPTFTLVQTYEAPQFDIWHCDLYRLGDPDEIVDLGLEDAITNAVSLIEWPDRLGSLAPVDALHITFDVTGDDSRALIFTMRDPRWVPVLETLRAL